jgi:hypothetical protein
MSSDIFAHTTALQLKDSLSAKFVKIDVLYVLQYQQVTKNKRFVNILYIRPQRFLGHADLQMATRYVQDVSEQTDRVIENSRKYLI